MLRLIAFLALILVATPLLAETGQLSPEKQALAVKLRGYLNEMKTLSGGFAQVSSDGAYSDGKVYLSRPGKMRLIYNPPSQTELVVRNETIIYHDKEFKQVNYYPLASTPLAVLLQEEFSFEKDVKIIDIARFAGVIELTLVDREDPGMGTVTLVFSEAPLELRKWVVVDAQGGMTQVSLLNPVLGQKINPKHFEFIDPQYDQGNN
ncbi:outer membrane lipoprotein carrier protein LolA [Terasakiella sp. SH-1]|uniref:LolA family protein n=1 Tax=Terasakiella sp. SH-1 TaxID=2560057 RepID=UPI00107381CC|nr:outer membrane lipoprotein carrier protein LolA [Terasakiella sp. SH-1]